MRLRLRIKIDLDDDIDPAVEEMVMEAVTEESRKLVPAVMARLEAEGITDVQLDVWDEEDD